MQPFNLSKDSPQENNIMFKKPISRHFYTLRDGRMILDSEVNTQ